VAAAGTAIAENSAEKVERDRWVNIQNLTWLIHIL